jgi:predicted double-glycine peptidase
MAHLRSDALDVTLNSGTLGDLQLHLAQGYPPIVFVQAGELPHWRGRVSQHAVVVVHVDENAVYVLDPAADPNPIAVPLGDFLLAWSEMEYLYALIVRVRAE